MAKLNNTMFDGTYVNIPSRSIFSKYLDIADDVCKELIKLKSQEKICPWNFSNDLATVIYNSDKNEEKIIFRSFSILTNNFGEHHCEVIIGHRYTGDKNIWLEVVLPNLNFRKKLYEGIDIFNKIPELINCVYDTVNSNISKLQLTTKNDWNRWIVDYSDKVNQLDKLARKYNMTIYTDDYMFNGFDMHHINLVSLKDDGKPYDDADICIKIMPELQIEFISVLAEKFSKPKGKFNSYKDMFSYLKIITKCIGEYNKLIETKNKILCKLIH